MRAATPFRLAVPLLLVALTAAAPPGRASAQGREGRVPKRPALESGRDTNSPNDYYDRGLELLRRRPDDAADAFYWASRLEPSWADPLYARQVATHMSDPNRFMRYMAGDPGVVEHPDVVRVDSLRDQALLRNPFLQERLFAETMNRLVYEISGTMATPKTIDDPIYEARWATSVSEFPKARTHYRRALKRYPRRLWLHNELATVFYHLQEYDSTVAELNVMLTKLRAREDDKKVLRYYTSKAFVEYSIALAHVAKGDAAAAREALGRALAEDLSFHMAHVALGGLALAQGDTAGALSEFDLAVQLAGDDPFLRHAYGTTLLSAGRHEAAAAQLARAVELEPYYAQPYLFLGQALERQGKPAEALAHYRGFVARAPRNDPNLPWARSRSAALGGGGGGGGGR